MRARLVSLSLALWAVFAVADVAADDAPADELLILASSACIEADCPGRVTGFWRGEGTDVWRACLRVEGTTQLAHRTLLRGRIERRMNPRRPLMAPTYACVVVQEVAATLAQDHELHPVTRDHAGPTQLCAGRDAQTFSRGFDASHIEIVEHGATWLSWVGMWASEMPESLVVEDAPTLAGSAIFARLEEAMRSTRGREIRREELFLPEVEDAALRRAMAASRVYEDPVTQLEATPMCRNGHLDFRVAAFPSIHTSDRWARWRGVMRSAVLNHGARPLDAAHPGCESLTSSR